jgi:hypothetical protein
LLRTLDVFESIEPAVARLQSTSSRNGRTQQYSAGA